MSSIRRETYLDANASAPLLPQAREAMLRVLDMGPGNASSPHAAGRRLRRVLGDAREQVAALVGSRPGEVVFTSGATESNTLAILGALAGAPVGRHVLVTTRAEHPSVARLGDRLERDGRGVRRAGVDRWGRVDAAQVAELVDAGTAVVAVVHAQSVTGALQPVEEIAAAAHRSGAMVHVDAAQSAGRVPVDCAAIGADLVALSAHKMGGPQGVGALVVRESAAWRTACAEGTQELGRRAGTEAVALAAGFGAAADVARAAIAGEAERMSRLLDPLRTFVDGWPGGEVWSPPDRALPNTCLVAFAGCPGDAVLASLDALGVRVSTGTACTSGARVAPEVLVAGGREPRDAARAVRISVAWDTSNRDVEALLVALGEVLPRVRAARQTG